METRVEFTEMFASYGRCLLAHLLAKMGILAVSIGAESVNAQAYSPYSASRAYTSRAYAPQSRGSVRRYVPPTGAFSNSESPAATGGGSLGYNQNLYNW
jgi:hypothetical protein